MAPCEKDGKNEALCSAHSLHSIELKVKESLNFSSWSFYPSSSPEIFHSIKVGGHVFEVGPSKHTESVVRCSPHVSKFGYRVLSHTCQSGCSTSFQKVLMEIFVRSVKQNTNVIPKSKESTHRPRHYIASTTHLQRGHLAAK